jgi:hypothetical protein
LDTLITFAIVGMAVLWAVLRIAARFRSRSTRACGSCSGCDVPARADCNSRTVQALVVVLLLAIPCGSSLAQETEDEETVASPPMLLRSIERGKAAFANVSGIELSGFFDVQAAEPTADADALSMGDFELDLARNLGPYTQLAAAVVANDEGTNLAVGFVDVHFFGGLIAPRGRLPVEKGFHLQFGKFDVPFGQDWQYYAAKDRIELSAPLTTESLLDGGFNDTGLRILGSTGGALNYSAFVVRSDDSGSLYGGRIGLAPFDNPYRFEPRTHVVETGLSVLQDIDGSGDARTTFWAVDVGAQLARWHFRAEYLDRNARQTEEPSEQATRDGWHATIAYDAGEHGPLALLPYARYDTVRELALEDGATPRTKRVSAGFNGTLYGFLVLKLEWQRLLASPVPFDAEEGIHRDSWLAQAVIVF